MYFWLCWVFVSVRGLSLVAASRGHSSSRCAGLSLSRPLFLQSTGSRRAGSVVMAHGPSCSAACGTFPDQGSNPCPLHWQADSQPLHYQGSPCMYIICCWLKKKCATWELRVKLYLGQNEDCSWGDSIPDSSEKLLQRGRGEGQYICDAGEGGIHVTEHISFFFLMKVIN